MTGDAPQPADTPRTSGEPWSYTDADIAWWRATDDDTTGDPVTTPDPEATSSGTTDPGARDPGARDPGARDPGATIPGDAGSRATDSEAAWTREVTGELAATGTRPRRRRRPASTVPANAGIPRVQPATGAAHGSEAAFAPGADFVPEAADAHAAGAHDAPVALDPPPSPSVDTAPELPVAAGAKSTSANAAPTAPDAEPTTAEPTTTEPTTTEPTTAEPTTTALTTAHGEPTATARPDAQAAPPADGVPDVMILPEPHRTRDRPTVALDRGTLGHAARLPRLTKARPPAQPAVDPVRAERLENSPFWLSDAERAAAGNAWPVVQTGRRADPSGPDDQPVHRHPSRTPRRPAAGLAGLVVLALVAAFFSWVSAEPFWLAVGHGDQGVATVGRCIGDGVTQRCAGTFAAADGGFTVAPVTLLGVAPDGRDAGAAATARMVSAESRRAYVGGAGPLLHLRWVLGFLLVLLCGYGIAGLTGARRLGSARARRAAVLTSLAGPLLLLSGFLAAAW